ncbi:hypothetical protein M413DRAFT_154640 [Hebeloma cylindrosporum]|uniref:Uncharacterized protein n=1 Tax=Hebeloma cylindrosporum TaxID=76867 RepID=A0A0C2YIG2_HEBCY|nr:hypothetical protein M413DRAFT_154640 [Hebeloma cylindrosporum h7]
MTTLSRGYSWATASSLVRYIDLGPDMSCTFPTLWRLLDMLHACAQIPEARDSALLTSCQTAHFLLGSTTTCAFFGLEKVGIRSNDLFTICLVTCSSSVPHMRLLWFHLYFHASLRRYTGSTNVLPIKAVGLRKPFWIFRDRLTALHDARLQVPPLISLLQFYLFLRDFKFPWMLKTLIVSNAECIGSQPNRSKG